MTTRTFRGIGYTPTIATSNSQTMIGTQGADWLEALGGDNQIFARSGNDVVLAGVKFYHIQPYAPFGGDAIFYDPLLDEAGNSIAGNNYVASGSGDDYVVTSLGNDLVYLGEGNDIFDGIGGNDTVIGGGGNDIVSVVAANTMNDSIIAGSGDDTVFLVSVNGGHHYIDGGSGNDDIVANGTSQIMAGWGDDLIAVTLAPGVNSDRSGIYADAGKDVLYAFTGDNLLYGGLDDDTIVSGRGDDTIFAGEGDDLVNLKGGAVTLRGHLTDFFNELFGGVPSVNGGGKDNVYLGRGKDTIVLGSGDNFKTATIYGFGADDRLDTGGLNVTFSHRGCNTIVSAGNNTLAILKGYTGCIH